jgi:branched-chain amino acid transport system permease protein
MSVSPAARAAAIRPGAGASPAFLLPLVVVAAAAPLVTSDAYAIGIMVLVCIFAVVAQAWNLVMGVAGIWWFGTVAAFGLGAYVNAILILDAGFPALLAFICGGLAALVLSLVVGAPAVRMRGVYVVLVTLAMHETLRIALTNDDSGLTGGTFGRYGFDAFGVADRSSLAGVRISYYLALLFLLASTAFLYRVTRSTAGYAFRALRDSEAYAVSRGIGRVHDQILVFSLTSFFSGLAGALYADHLGAVSPTILSFDQFTLLLAMIVIGGWGTFWGPIAGTALIMYVSERLRAVEDWRLLLLATLMIGTIVLLPSGLSGLATRLRPLTAGVRARLYRWLEG